MRLPVFLIGLCAIAAAAVAVGMLAGFGTGRLVLFVVVTLSVVQIAYVALVAMLAAKGRKVQLDQTDKRGSIHLGDVSSQRDI